jgi:hypothetical protein
MPPFFNLIRDICLLRRAPQDLPYSVANLFAVVVACVLLDLAVAVVRATPLADALAGAVLGLGFTLGTLNLVLSLRGLRNRFVQAATALLACALAFTLLSLPLLLLTGEPPKSAATATPLQLLLSAIGLPLLVWQVIVEAHVLRHSLDVPFLTGIMIAILWIVAILALGAAAGAPGL